MNMHVGITPLYRGVYGAYWALVENNRKACGVTIHLVDPGIDTGGILEQGIIYPTEEDNCVTYQYLQLAVGLDLLKKVITEVGSGNFEIKPNPPGPSRLWSHPTLWDYLYYRITYGIK
jgi:methionyl-tRNA formyltransferase